MVVGVMVGSGIFLLPGYAAASVSSGWMLLFAWFLGGVMALLGALSTAELATRYPHTGGDFIYLLRVFGRLPAFLYGWMCLTVTGGGSVAILALFSAKYSVHFLPYFQQSSRAEVFIAIIIVILLTSLHCLRVTVGARFQSVLSVVKVGGIIVFAVYLLGSDTPAELATVSFSGESWKGFSKALIPIYFAYSGWNSAGYLAGEVAKPGKTLPMAFIAGTSVTIALYMLLNSGFLHVLGLKPMQGDALVPVTVLEMLGNSKAIILVNFLILVSVLSSLSIVIQTSARILQSMGENGVFFRRLGEVHPFSRTPVIALVLQGVLSIVLMFLLDIEKLVDSTTVVMVLFSALVISALLKVRRYSYNSGKEYTFLTPLYPFVPLAYIGSALFITVGVVQYYVELGSVLPLWGLGILVAGLPVYFLWNRIVT